MSQLQDKVREDLKRFMSEEPADNIGELRKTVKKRLVTTDSIKIVRISPKVRKRSLYSDSFDKKLSKVRPQYMIRLVGLLLCGFSFGMLGVLSMLIVKYPYNLVLVLIALTPLIVTVVKWMRYEYHTDKKRKFL